MENLTTRRENIVKLLKNVIELIEYPNKLIEIFRVGKYNPDDFKDDESTNVYLTKLFNSSDPEVQNLIKNSGLDTQQEPSITIIKDILYTFEKIEDNSYFYDKAKESVAQINLLLEAKNGLYELLDYYMEHVSDYTYNQSADHIELVVSKFTQIKPKIVTKDHGEGKILYVASKPVRKGNIEEFTSYMGDDDFYFKKYRHDVVKDPVANVDQVTTLNHVHDLSFGNYFVIINGDTYPAFYSLDDIDGKIKPFYAGSGVIFNLMNI